MKVPLYEDVLENVVISTFCTSESERRKEQNRNMEDMDFGCGEPCCGEPYLGFGLQKVGWLLKARQLPNTSNSCNATRIEH